jgi:hypothetical protein
MTAWTQEQIDAEVVRLELDGNQISTVVEGRCFINGVYVEATSKEWIESKNPGTNKEVARIAAGEKEDVDLAVDAARAAFESGIGPIRHRLNGKMFCYGSLH